MFKTLWAKFLAFFAKLFGEVKADAVVFESDLKAKKSPTPTVVSTPNAPPSA